MFEYKAVLTIRDICQRTGLSRWTVLPMLMKSPSGLIIVNHPATMHRGRRRTIRIPWPVYLRIFGPGHGIVKERKGKPPGKKKLC
jgi:hypothetical protein